VEFGPLGACSRHRTPSVGLGRSHETLLLGLPSASEICYRVVPTEGPLSWPEPFRTVHTGNLPAAVPDLNVTIKDLDQVEEGFWLAASGINPGLVLIFDRDGEVVWYQPADVGYVSPQALPDPATNGFMYNRFSKDFDDDVGSVLRLHPDGQLLEEIRTPLAHHSFARHEDGTTAWLALDVRDHDEWGTVVGDALREVAPDGADRAVWSSWNDWEVIDPLENDGGFYPQGIDWTHGNFLAWDPARQSYTVSFRNVNTIVEVDRDGHILRGVGDYADPVADEVEDLVHYPHSAHWTDQGTLLFTTTPGDGKETWAVELAFDPETGEAERVWSWGEGEGFYARVLGEALRMDNGNTVVNFGSAGVVVELTPSGEVAWRLETPAGYFPGHLTYIRDIYDPAAQDGEP